MIIKDARFSPAFLLILILFASCNEHRAVIDNARPRRTLKEYFDKKYLLYKLPEDYYGREKLNQSFKDGQGDPSFQFKPLGYNPGLNLQYTHVYSNRCVIHTSDTIWKYAEVCFPNTCLSGNFIHAGVLVRNPSDQEKTFYVRICYQNTTYWYPTDDSMDLHQSNYLDNYYGVSAVFPVTLAGGKDSVMNIPYHLGHNPKNEFNFDASKDLLRAGNYEFMALVLPDKQDPLMDTNIYLLQTNPFAEVKRDQLLNGGKKYGSHMAYTGPHHFKFVFLDEYFDGANDLAPDHIYLPKNGKEKKLCDTCSGWYRNVISENWKPDDFFKGFIHQAGYVKADYGIKSENCRIDSNGITLTIPASTQGSYKKTWGEVLFGPSFRYGHLTVHAKFAQMKNRGGTPNGIIHNLWLYQRDADPVDMSNPYHYLQNGAGVQPYEIDFEIWNSEEGIYSPWSNRSFINYSIVDYMRDAGVQVKPGENKQIGKYKVNRLNNRQVNIPGEQLPPEYFDSFHTYELYWLHDHVRFLVDGKECAYITKDMAKIPDKYLFLWIGSPLYQDGTYYSQSEIPFLEKSKQTIIDYIRID